MKVAKTTADSNALVPVKYNLFFFHTKRRDMYSVHVHMKYNQVKNAGILNLLHVEFFVLYVISFSEAHQYPNFNSIMPIKISFECTTM